MSQSNASKLSLAGPSSSTTESNKKGSASAPDLNTSTNGNGGFYATSSFPGLCVTSEEINFLVYRYLQESGFVHSAFTFAYESSIAKNSFKNADVPPGALITFLQKGLQYLGIEENLNDDGSERKRKKRRSSNGSSIRNGAINQNHSDEDSSESSQDSEKFSLLSPHACRALGRKNPPIRLNVPPATAAAVVTAKMAAEAAAKAASAKQKPNKNGDTNLKRGISGSMSNSESNNVAQGMQSKPQYSSQFQSQASASPGRSNSSTPSFNAAAAAAAMSQLHRQVKNISPPPSGMGNGNNNFAVANQDSFGKNVNLGNLPLTNRTSSSTPNSNAGQPSSKSSELYMSNIPSDSAAMSVPGFKSSLGKSRTKNKNNAQQTNLPSTGNQSSSLPKQNSSLAHLHSIPGALTPQQSWSIALDQAAARIEANNKNMKIERETSLGATGSQQRVQALMNAAAAGALASTPSSLSANRSQSTGVGVEQNGNPSAGTKLISNQISSSSLNVKNSGVNRAAGMPHEVSQNLEKFRNASVPGRQIFGAAINPHAHNQQPMQALSAQSQSHPQQSADQSGDNSNNLDDSSTQILPSEIVELSKHTSEVFMCSWNQVHPYLIATGSGDASARIWTMNGPTAKSGCGTSRLLKHGNPTDKNKDVTTLEWSPDGDQLATGSYDGVARVWTKSGELVHTLRTHRGPIFSLKWNKRGNYLLSGSYDKTTIVWDVSGQNAFVKQQFDIHYAPALDVDWKDDNTFASCSTDKSVHICRVGAARPIITYTGHTDEVNAVKWDPSGTLLASCSDDCTAKVWDVSSGRNAPLYDFKSHKQEIYTVKWSPTGKGSPNPSKPLMLATASFDGTVRLWNIQNGTCIRILSRHRDSVYSVSFSPSGEYLASGSLAGQLYIWNVQDGNHVKSYKGEGDIFEVAWNKDESRVAACFSSNVVAVIDFKR